MNNKDADDFLRVFAARSRQYADEVNRNEVTDTWASLEVLMSIFSALEDGISEEQIAECYPVSAWRDDKVEVPRALLRPIVQAWIEYTDESQNLTLGEAFKLEGGGSGKRPAKALQRTKDRDRRLSNLAIIDYYASAKEGTPVSQDAVFQAIADAEGVSYETVRKAYQKYSPSTLLNLKDKG